VEIKRARRDIGGFKHLIRLISVIRVQASNSPFGGFKLPVWRLQTPRLEASNSPFGGFKPVVGEVYLFPFVRFGSLGGVDAPSMTYTPCKGVNV